jgi:hypothetical protein
MGNKTENEGMRLHGDYFTVQEMSNILGESTNTIKKRILRLGIKATVKNALYTSSDFENIKSITMGRPKKPETENKTTKPVKKPVTKGKKKK